jgi:hypothetical protein
MAACHKDDDDDEDSAAGKEAMMIEQLGFRVGPFDSNVMSRCADKILKSLP